MCAGCMSCIELCPNNAIKIEDTANALNAIIDPQKCCECHLCKLLCQYNNPPQLKKPQMWKQGWSLDQEIRKQASSGGVATAIEKAFVEHGGVVCSCTFKNGEFKFEFSENSFEIKKYMGSKYIKSSPIGIYKALANKLNHGQKVLFIGLPCQVAAVKNYTHNPLNLYTVDLICHGTPSVRILNHFLQDLGTKISNINTITFREKNIFKLQIDDKSYAIPNISDDYLVSFLRAICYTENCYSCRYARIERIGDITLGDSWGSDLDNKEQNKGVSLILCQNNKGEELLKQGKLKLLDVNLKRAIEYNHQLQHPSSIPVQRKKFFHELEKGTKFKCIVRKCFPIYYLKKTLKIFLYSLHMSNK